MRWKDGTIVTATTYSASSEADCECPLYVASNIEREEEHMNELYEAIEQKIKVFMQDAEVAENDHYRISWKNSTSNRIDTTRLKAEMPDVYTHFCKPTQSRRFLVKAVS